MRSIPSVLVISVGLLALQSVGQQVVPDRVHLPSGIVWGMRISGKTPVFPAEAKAQRVSGAVILRVIIGKDGKVKEITPVGGPELLRKPYMDAVRTWTYRPYLVNGTPVEVETTVMIDISVGY